MTYKDAYALNHGNQLWSPLHLQEADGSIPAIEQLTPSKVVAYLPEPSSKEGRTYRKRFKDKVTKGAKYGKWGMNPTVEFRLKKPT